MSLDKSLRSHGALARHRNVLSRAERLDTLKDEERWDESGSVFGLPKVAHRKVTTKKIKAAPTAEEAAAAEAAAPAAGEALAPAAKDKPAGKEKPSAKDKPGAGAGGKAAGGKAAGGKA